MSLWLLPQIPSLGMIGKCLAPPFLCSLFQFTLMRFPRFLSSTSWAVQALSPFLSLHHLNCSWLGSPLLIPCVKLWSYTSVQLSEFMSCLYCALLALWAEGQILLREVIQKWSSPWKEHTHRSKSVDGLQKMFFSWCYSIQKLRRRVCGLCSPMFLFGRRNTLNKCPEGARTVILRNSFWHSS